jgi:hypothetical protein
MDVYMLVFDDKRIILLEKLVRCMDETTYMILELSTSCEVLFYSMAIYNKLRILRLIYLFMNVFYLFIYLF